ncbi:MAG: MarR family transcriptional regulator [Micromonosporaceae bacterium]
MLVLQGHGQTADQGTPERRCTGLPQPTRKDFENLLAFRVSLRRFQYWSENQAHAVGLTHVQHQLLVAVKGHPGGMPPTVSDIAGYLLLRHHSVVELVDRAEAGGFVRRGPDASDGRIVRVRLTNKGDRLVTDLTEGHLAELHKLAAVLAKLAPEPAPGPERGAG